MLNTLIRDTLIDLATKRYGRVTTVLSEWLNREYGKTSS